MTGEQGQSLFLNVLLRRRDAASLRPSFAGADSAGLAGRGAAAGRRETTGRSGAGGDVSATEADAWTALWRRIREDEAYAAIRREVREEAARHDGEPVPPLTWSLFRRWRVDGDRQAYEAAYFRRRKRLTAHALRCLIWPEDARFLDALCETVWAVCDEFTWCLPAHFPWPEEEKAAGTDKEAGDRPETGHRFSSLHVDLFAAETAFALAEILRLTGDRLPRLLRDRIRYETFRRVLFPFLHGGPFDWETARHNWSAVCAGAVGAAALYLMEDADELAKLLERVLRALDCFLDGYGGDGVCLEGYGYWVYGFGFFVYFADLLYRRTEGGLDLLAPDKVRNIAAFQQHAFLSGTHTVCFSDALPQTPVFLGLAHYLHRRFPEAAVPEAALRAPLAADHCGRWAPALRNVIWYDPALQGAPWPTEAVYFPDAQWLVCRRADEIGTFAFAAKAGHNAEPHNHNDIGSFLLHADGETFLADLGCGLYSAAYFGPERYTFLCNGSHGHSVPIIGGRTQRAGAGARARVRSARTGGFNAELVLEAASAYRAEPADGCPGGGAAPEGEPEAGAAPDGRPAPALREWIRRFDWRGEEPLPRLVLEDRFAFDRPPADVVERFICAVPPEPEGDGRFTLRGRTRALAVRYHAASLDPVVTALTYDDHFGNKTVCYALDLRVRQPAETTVVRVEFAFLDGRGG